MNVYGNDLVHWVRTNIAKPVIGISNYIVIMADGIDACYTEQMNIDSIT